LFQNLLSKNAGTSRATEANRVYTIPYIVDTVGSLTGVRLHWPTIQASDRNMQMVVDASNGLTLGAAEEDIGRKYSLVHKEDEEELSPLGLSLQWGDGDSNSTSAARMTSHIVRGMPYATMQYEGGAQPAIAGGKIPVTPPLVDGNTKLECGDIILHETTKKPKSFSKSEAVSAKEVQMHFKGSDFTCVVFFSRPVQVSCSVAPENDGPGLIPETMFQMHVTDETKDMDTTSTSSPLIVRLALVSQCTTGHSSIHEHCVSQQQMKDPDGYLEVLRENAGFFPKNPKMEVDFSSKEEESETEDSFRVTFDWDVQKFNQNNDTELLMFALPHHQTGLEPLQGESTNEVLTNYCTPTFHGETCLVKGSKWSLVEKLGKPLSFIGARPPASDFIPDLADAISHDLGYELPDNMYRAAADTYFPGKVLARLGRVILIATELRKLAGAKDDTATNLGEYDNDMDPKRYSLSVEASKKVAVPSKDDITQAVDRLRHGVQVWIDGTGETQYVYDTTWGGLVNCGCHYKGTVDKGVCTNTFPECPALSDVNENFGNGFYNDHHFHYGYHIYAAAVVAKFDPEWGRKYFDRVMLYVRDIANPSAKDAFFPQYRHKDWFLGSSWASGFISANTMHGRNQESSSEAIAAYESVALFDKC
jgi:hypothetical protein